MLFTHHQNCTKMMIKTRAEVRQEFARRGWSISAWAKCHSYNANLVISILADDETCPRIKCLRGDSHRIAVQLGLKDGDLVPMPLASGSN